MRIQTAKSLLMPTCTCSRRSPDTCPLRGRHPCMQAHRAGRPSARLLTLRSPNIRSCRPAPRVPSRGSPYEVPRRQRQAWAYRALNPCPCQPAPGYSLVPVSRPSTGFDRRSPDRSSMRLGFHRTGGDCSSRPHPFMSTEANRRLKSIFVHDPFVVPKPDCGVQSGIPSYLGMRPP